MFWQSCNVLFLGSVIISDCVHGVGHSPVLQILLQISVKTSIMVFPQLEQILLVYYQLQKTSPFTVILLQSQLPHGGSIADLLGAGCSPVLHCLHNLIVVQFGAIFCPSAENLDFKEVENIFDPWLFPAAFLTKYFTGCISHCCIVVVIMVSLSMSSSLSPMSGANFLPIVA